MDKKERLTCEFLKGKVSRRDFSIGLANMGLSAAAVGAFVSQTIKDARADEPKKGGHMRVASDSSHAGDTLDPAKITSGTDIMRSGLLYNRLIDFLPGQGLVGNLATGWEPNGDATQWTIELLDGVEFHNGKTMGAADVAYSFNRHLDPEVGSPANAYLGDVDTIVADGDRHVVFNMKQPNADIPYLLTEYHFTVQPEGQDAAAYAAGEAVGTGPWKVQEFDPGIVAVFERFPNYHRSGLPYIDTIETFGIPDNASRVNALLAGEVEIMTDLDASLIGTVEAAGNAHVLNQPGGAHATFPMRFDTAPYSDNNVRLAIKHAIHRDRMLELAWGGFGTVGRDHPIPQFDPFFAADVEALPHDPDKVAYYLKQAGMENATFEVSASDGTFGGSNASVVMAELMNESGLNVRVQKVPSDGFWSAVWRVVPWCASNWYGRPTADLMLSVAYLSDVPWNESYWSNERFDKLVLQGRQETDDATRKEIYRDIQVIMRDEGSTLTPVFTNWLDAYSDKVKNLKGHPHGFAGWMYWEDVWLDDGSA
ncbi:MAG: ABC transporter substrate-binding protein [Pseudomonadota bacterium]